MSQDGKPTAESSVQKHPKAVSLLSWAFIVGISIGVAGIFYLFSIPFGLFIVLSIDATKALVEAIATILGFFGLIAVYLLTSYDNRIDKLEEKIQDSNDNAKIERFRVFQQDIKTRKKNVTISIIVALGSLFVSFFLSIATLGILGVNPEHPTETALQYGFGLAFVASILLFIGVLAIFVMVYKIGTEPK